jgi:acetoin utilization protein AcuB
MIRHGVGGLPVVDKNNVVIGLINDFDLLVELQHLLGATDPGWRVTVRTPSKRGEFLKLTEAISDKGWSIMAMGSVRPPKAEDHWDIIIKVWGCTQAELTEVVNSIEDHELRDIRETTTHLHRK